MAHSCLLVLARAVNSFLEWPSGGAVTWSCFHLYFLQKVELNWVKQLYFSSLLWYIVRMEADYPPFSQAIQRPTGEWKGVVISYSIKQTPFGAALSSRKISNNFFFLALVLETFYHSSFLLGYMYLALVQTPFRLIVGMFINIPELGQNLDFAIWRYICSSYHLLSG